MSKLSIHHFNVFLLFVCLQLMSDNIRNTAQNVHRNADYIAVRGQFVLDNNHNYGFDDYTNWTFGSSDYYNEPQARKGKCSLPYISVQVQQRGYTKP